MQRKLFSIILFTQMVFATGPSYTQATAVFNLSKNQLISAQNFDTLFNPASIQKLFTAFAALKMLGEDYNFATTIATTAPISHGELPGDIIVGFSGDPTLETKDLQELFAPLAGINIQGRVILTGSSYDHQNYGPGWMWDELDDGYAGPISNFTIDHNCTAAYITNVKGHAHVELNKALDIPLRYNIHFSQDPNEECSLVFEPGHKGSYLLTGCTHKNQDHIDIAIRDPQLHIKNTIASILASQHTTFAKGILITDEAPNTSHTKAFTHSSETLTGIITKMLKKSDNLIAESLFKTISKVYHNSIGNWKGGQTAVLNILANSNIILDDRQLKDGSGLSRYNTLTPRQVIELLKLIKRDRKAFPIIFNALPVSGAYGTLEWLTDLPEVVHAKTGSISNAYNLAGYFSNGSEDYAFVIMTNNFLAGTKTQKQFAKETLLKLLQDNHAIP